jgi:hypothetical protein
MKHGQYVNIRGKENMSMKIASAIKSMLGEKDGTFQCEMEKC